MRTSPYEQKIKPHLAEVKEWLSNGATLRMIADNLKISRATLFNMRKTHPEFEAVFKAPDSHKIVVTKLYGRLVEIAMGYEEQDEEIIKEANVEGKIVKTVTKTLTRTIPPNIAAINLLLKNWDKLHWSNDPAELEIRKKEMEIQQARFQKDYPDEEKAQIANDAVLEQLKKLKER